MFLIAVPLAILVLYMATAGSAYISAMTAKAHVSWLGQVFNIVTAPAQLLIKVTVQLAKYIAAELEPSFLMAEGKMAGWLSGIGQTFGWNASHAHRNSAAMWNTANWANIKLRAEILNEAGHLTKSQTTTIIKTKTPTLPARRVSAKDNAVAFRSSFDAAFPGQLVKDYPKVDWGTKKWRAWLGVLPAAGSIAIPFPRVIPRPTTIPKAQKKINDSTGKRLKRLEKILGITGLAGLITATFGGEITRFLRCGNTRGIAKAWCGANLKALLGLLGGLVAVVGTFSLIDFAKFLQPLIADGAKTALHFWRADIENGIDQAFGDGGGAAVRDPGFGSA